MPSAFETSFAKSTHDGLYSTFGIAAVYADLAGTKTICTVRIHREDAHQVDRPSHVSGEIQVAPLEVRTSEISKVVKGGRFTVEGVEVWTVETTPVLKNGQHYCTCSRSGAERMMPKRSNE